jgi:hypothetical protein
MGDLLLQSIGATVRVETVLEKNLWAVMIDATHLELVILSCHKQPWCDAARGPADHCDKKHRSWRSRSPRRAARG